VEPSIVTKRYFQIHSHNSSEFVDEVKDEKPIQRIDLPGMKLTKELQPKSEKPWTFSLKVLSFEYYFGSESERRMTNKKCCWQQIVRMNGKR
jgi:hypothetical protein